MASLSRKRVVGEASSRTSIKSKRTSVTPSPARPHSGQRKKRPRKKEDSQQLWAVKGIQDEKQERGVTKYLVKWAGLDPKTGKPYVPSWEPAEHILPDVLENWEETKRRRARESSDDPPTSPIESTQESSPIRPPKRRRLHSKTRETSYEGLPERKIARAGVKGISVRSGTAVSTESHSKQREIKDSYEDESNDININEEALPRVEIPVDEDFDRTAYSTFSSSPQFTQTSSPQQPQSFYRLHNSPQLRRWRTTAPTRYTDEGIIPDSQDLLGSLSYQHTETPTSITGTSTSHSTERNTEGGTQELLRARGRETLHSTNTPDTPSQSTSQQPLEFESSSWQQRSHDSAKPNSSIDIPSAQRRPSLAPSPGFSARLSSSSTKSKKAFADRDQSSSLAQPQGFWSEPSQNPASPLQPSQASEQNSRASSSPRFLTQVPLDIAESLPESSSFLSKASSSRRAAYPDPLSRERSLPLLAQEHLSSLNSQRSTFTRLQNHSGYRPPNRSLASSGGEAVAASSNPSPHLSVNAKISSESQGEESQLSKSRSQGEKSSSSHLPSPPFEAHPSTVSSAAYNTQPSRQVTPTPSLPLSQHSQESRFAAEDQSSPSQNTDKMPDLEPEDFEGSGYEVPLAPIASFSSAATPPPIIAPAFPTMASNFQAVAANSAIPVGDASDAATSAAMMNAVLERFAPIVPESSHIARVLESSLEDAEMEASVVGSLVEVPDEYLVPLPMTAQTRDVYNTVLGNYLPQISELLSGAEAFSVNLVKDIDTMFTQLQELCDHQSLHESDTPTQRQEERSVIARWAENISTKCMFLAEFLESIRHTDRNVCIMVRPGRMADIVECILDHHDFAHSIAGGLGNYGDSGESMKITLLPTDTNAETAVITDVQHGDGARSVESVPRNQEDMFDIIIAVDSTYDSLTSVHNLKRNLMYPYKRAPMICLVVANSFEHLDRLVPACEDQIQRKITIVAHLQQIAQDDSLGVVPSNGWGPEKAAELVERFITLGSNPRAWDLPSLPVLEELKVEDEDEDEGEENQQDAAPTQDSLPASGIKRQLSEDNPGDYYSPKRQRISPVPDQASSTGPHSRFNVSSHVSANESPARRNGLRESDIAELEVMTLRNELQALQQRYDAKSAAEAELITDNEKLAAEVKDLKSSFSKAGPKYQDALNDRGSFEYQKKAIEKQNENLVKKLEFKTNAYDKLKLEKEAADIELADMKKTLRESTVPEIAEMQILRDEVASLKDKNTRLEKKVTSEANTSSYLQEQYQNASKAFSEGQEQIQTLEETVERTLRQANDNIVKIHEINKSTTIDEFRKVNKALLNENENLKALLTTAAEQLAVANAARRTTRGQSMPRSPQIGQGTMSPRQNPGINAQRFGINSGVIGSRGNSPAPADFGGDGAGPGARVWNGRGALGEVMFGALPGGTPGNAGASGENSRGALGPSRFGNHLQ